MRYDRSKVLAPKFTLDHTISSGTHYWTIEDNGRKHVDCVGVGDAPEARARAHLAHLNKEHANGRVPHTVCEHGPCDWRRLTDPRTTPPEALARAVLCDEHAARINAM